MCTNFLKYPSIEFHRAAKVEFANQIEIPVPEGIELSFLQSSARSDASGRGDINL